MLNSWSVDQPDGYELDLAGSGCPGWRVARPGLLR
jgi:hypothetical protein